jgi:predicted amidohydrolase
MAMKDSSYGISCLQTEIHVIQNAADKERLIKRNLERSIELAAHAVATEESRLLILPEAWLQGFVPSRSIREWLNVCITIPGPETEKLGEFCHRHGTYIAGTAFERSDLWHDRMFNTAFIVGPSGEVELKYRQINPETLNGLLPVTSPADVLDEYPQREGELPLFPVLDAPLGRLACLVGNDVNFFEHTRTLVLRGAEILLHLTGEATAASHPVWEEMRRARAYENVAYFASVNNGGLLGSGAPRVRSRGHSEIINYEGKPVAAADSAGEIVLCATISLQRLRYRRTQVRMNFPAQSKIKMYAPTYRKAERIPNNAWASRPVESSDEGPQLVRKVIEAVSKSRAAKA